MNRMTMMEKGCDVGASPVARNSYAKSSSVKTEMSVRRGITPSRSRLTSSNSIAHVPSIGRATSAPIPLEIEEIEIIDIVETEKIEKVDKEVLIEHKLEVVMEVPEPPPRNVKLVDGRMAARDPPPQVQRRNSVSTPTNRRSSFITAVRDLVQSRTGSLGAAMFKRPSQGVRKVQVAECNVEAVYDLRDKEANFYDDDQGFRRPRSNSSDLLVLRKTSRPISFNVVGVIDQKTDPYHQYMSLVDVYELCPNNSKVVIIDSKMLATRAFQVMREQNITTLIVFDSVDERRIRRSILTLTDCLIAIRNDPKRKDGGPLLAGDILSGNSLVAVGISSKILDLCEELHQNRLHRVVVLDDGKEVACIISVRRVIAAIHKQNRSLHFAQWLSKSIGLSSIGTWDEKNIATISKDATVYRAMEDMLGFHYSALPVTDGNGKVIGVITKTDICKALPLNFIEPKRWLQETKIADILHICRSKIFISSADSIGQVLDTILTADSYTAFAIHDGKAIGVISLFDFLTFILRCPLAPTIEEPPSPPSAIPTPESTSSMENMENLMHKL